MENKKAYTGLFVFVALLTAFVVIAEVGNRNTSFTKDGSFFMLFFWSCIISGIFTLILIGLSNNDK